MTKQHFPSDAAVQSLIQSRINEHRAIGIVVGIVEANGSTRVFAAGQAGQEAQPLGPLSVFEIGSVTKVFTGILLADMVAKQEVALSDPIEKFLPENVTVPTRAGAHITLLDLATHRSSLPRLPDNLTPANENNPYADYTIEQLYAFLNNYTLDRDIGSDVEYSNLGAGLLGHVLARASDRSYPELLQERIFEPLGMSDTGITLSEKMKQWLALGHDPASGVVPNWDMGVFESAGGLSSNMTDMLTFIKANMSSAESPVQLAMRSTHEPRNGLSETESFGLNWIIMDVGNDKIIWHDGGTGGYGAFAGFDPVRKVGVVVLANSIHEINDIGLHLINANLPLAEPPLKRTEVEISTALLRSYVGDYELELDKGFTLSVRFNDGALWVQATNQSSVQVYPQSANEFFYKVVDAQITFEVDELGHTKALVLHQEGMDMRATKR